MEMRTGNLWEKILIYSVPLMLTNLLQLFFNIADIAIVGKFAGSLSLGAVGSTSLLIALTTGILIGISSGVNAKTALYMGADDWIQERKSVNTGFFICLIVGVMLLIFGIAGSAPILRLLGTKDELIAEAILYFRLYMLGSPALALFNYGNAVLSAAGDTKKPLRYLTISGVINVILNLFFVMCCHMTSNGVALASILAQYIAAFLILKELACSNETYRLRVKELSFDSLMAGKILAIGIPAAIQHSMFCVANLFVQSAVNSFDHITVEGNSAAMNFDSIVYDMMAALYTACTSFIAQNFGARQMKRVKQTYLITTLYSCGVAVVLGVIIFFLRVPLLYIFTNDASVVEKGAIRLGILSLSYWISGFMDNATAACRGLGKTVIPTIIVFFGSVVFRILWIYTVFAYFHSLQSLYVLYACAFTFTSIMGNTYFFYLYRKIRCV